MKKSPGSMTTNKITSKLISNDAEGSDLGLRKNTGFAALGLVTLGLVTLGHRG